MHASKKKKHSPEGLEYGAILGYVTLVNLKKYETAKDFEGDRERHQVFHPLKSISAKRSVYGFVLENPFRFQSPIPCNGALNFWEYKGDPKLEFPQVFGTSCDNVLQKSPSLDTTS